MKKIIIAAAFLLTGVLSAQEVTPKYEEVNNKTIKATYYHDNGLVKQTGNYRNGKLHGTWVSYNADGSKQAVAQYENGKKVGKWFFYTGNTISEVNYGNSQAGALATNK
jgi:antitoxin component YwqK of YwqJK toxin-antitoxin module